MSNEVIRQPQQEIDLAVTNMIKTFLASTYGTRYPDEQRLKISEILPGAVVIEFKRTSMWKELPPTEQDEQYLLRLVKLI
ncbi:hypothetical protein D3C84_616940 [compost metagenome]